MTLREATIAKLQQLPEPLLEQVSDFIDSLAHHQPSHRNDDNYDISTEWAGWFESVDHIETETTESVSEYQQLLLAKYRQQGLNL